MCGVCGVHLAFPSFRTLTRLLWAVSYSVSNYMLKIILYFFIGVAQFIFIALFAGLFGKEKDSP